MLYCRCAWRAALWMVVCGACADLRGDEGESGPTYSPPVAEASDDAQRSLARIRIPQDLKVELFAAEPLLANPVAFCIDERGRFYVAETFRHHAGVTDNRNHMDWLVDDLASRTVTDRVAMYRKYLGDQFATYATEHERVRLVEDTDGDGRADRATVFADGFSEAADGIGAGLLARDGKVWFTCIPSLWLLEDQDGDGRAEKRSQLQTGYGVHVAFLGHDLHGLKLGPDGKLYFSIGDRGFHVKQGNKTIAYPDTGAVLRCQLDGSDLEVVATGLRNPQELAFDEFGNLFTGDNNSDGGDKARWVHVVEGGDSGWRIGYQYLNTPHRRGPWNSEKLWYPAPEGDAAYLLPPLANFADGPSGLTYYPGTGLSDKYRGCFFLCDFRGAAGFSGVRSLRLKPRGASFEVVDAQQPIWSLLATDIEFGADGALYIADWVDGWDKPGKGRIFRVFDPQTAGSAELVAVKRLLSEPMAARSIDERMQLLSHADMRVRQSAQFALAAEGAQVIPRLQAHAAQATHALSRIHAIWALGQLARQHSDALATVPALLADSDPEIQAQAAKTLGDARVATAQAGLIELLRSPAPRVQFFAAMALARLEAKDAVQPLFDLLKQNADRDRYLRHAAVMGLVGCASDEDLRRAAGDASPAVRMGSLLAMRRRELADVATFLRDAEPAIVVEAARAIYDTPITAGYPALAELASITDLREPVALRALAANSAVGGAAAAQRIAAIAGQDSVAELVRVEALRTLGSWANPPTLDRLLGAWRPQDSRSAADGSAALESVLPSLLASNSENIRLATAAACGELRLAAAAPGLTAWVDDTARPVATRVAALAALGSIQAPGLDEVVERAVADQEADLRTEGLRLLARISPQKALPLLDRVLQSGTTGEQQGAFASLGEMQGGEVEAVLVAWLDRALAGKVAPEVQLDLLEAAARHSGGTVAAKLADVDAARKPDDHLAAFRETLAGGDAGRGRTVFFEKTAAACLRCHKIGGRGGDVGPNLSHVAKNKSREYLLEAIVTPNRQIAEGFETVVVATSDGRTITGVFKSEDDRELRLTTFEGAPIVIAKSDIEERGRGVSAMPEQTAQQLTKREIRDLVEFLASQK